MTKVHNEPARTSYPVYDGYGNMIAALSFNRPALGSGGTYPVPGSYGVSIGGERLYDAWGGVRAGQSHGYPNHRYCANLGHIADDETGLTYMRARYYEPSTGRFISEDSAMDGRNWYVYCWNNPVERIDPSGQTLQWTQPTAAYFMTAYSIGTALAFLAFREPLNDPSSISRAIGFSMTALEFFMEGLGATPTWRQAYGEYDDLAGMVIGAALAGIGLALAALAPLKSHFVGASIGALALGYLISVYAALCMIEMP